MRVVNAVVNDVISSDLCSDIPHADAMSLMQCRTRTALELSRTRRSADDRYYYETPEFNSVHAECTVVITVRSVIKCLLFCTALYLIKWQLQEETFTQLVHMFMQRESNDSSTLQLKVIPTNTLYMTAVITRSTQTSEKEVCEAR